MTLRQTKLECFIGKYFEMERQRLLLHSSKQNMSFCNISIL